MSHTTVGTVHDGKEGVYIGRPRHGEPWNWGNPFTLQKFASRNDAIANFEEWLAFSQDPRAEWMRENIHTLKGKHLKCFCKPLACHGDVLAKYADKT